MVTQIDRMNSDYTIYYDEQAQLYRAMCNKCGGDNTENASKSVTQQAVVDLLTNGGSIFLKAMTLDPTVLATLPSDVLVIEDYQGYRTFYRDAKKLFELQDLADLVVGL